MDSTKKNLVDFEDIDGADIFERAEKFDLFVKDLHERKHLQFRRVAYEGSAPLRKVKDPYTGEIREMIYLASNDYLNLTTNPEVINAGIDALKKYGAGAGSVPLLGGTIDLHAELENKIAAFKFSESAIIYTSGYGSNLGTIMSLMNKKDIVIMDALSHASIADGSKNSNVKRFIHNDMESLEMILKKVQGAYRTKLIAVDGVYSMDGDICPLDDIINLAKKYGAYTFVDDAHATGVIGKTGKGTAEHFELEGKIDIVAGTFSKGIGVVGGFIAASKEIIRLLHYYSRPYVFSTAMTPQATGSIIKAIEIIASKPEIRNKLWDNIRYFSERLNKLNFNLGNQQTAIFPIVIGDDLVVKESCRLLQERNIYVNPVMYPAVSRKLSRLRISITAGNTTDQLDYVADALEELDQKFNFPKTAIK